MIQGFKSPAPARRLLETHAAVFNAFNIQWHLLSRGALRVPRRHQESFRSRGVCDRDRLAESPANLGR